LPTITLQTHIAVPIQKLFNLYHDIDFHQQSASNTQEKAIAGRTSGLIEFGESVTWEGLITNYEWSITNDLLTTIVICN